MKTAIVTGGAHGIGKAIVLKLLNTGCAVTVLDINDEYIGQLTDEKRQHLHMIRCDVGNADEVADALQKIETYYEKIDYLVNNAGISLFEPIDRMTIDAWNRILSVNLSSIFFMAKFGKHLLAKHSAIVNIASTRAFMSEPHGEAYGASKGGIIALTNALAISLAPTRVNCISPGWIEINHYSQLSKADHSQHPCGRVGLPEDIAEMTAFLLSEKATFITGQNFVVDGGMTKKMMYLD